MTIKKIILFDFSVFNDKENFIKTTIKKQVELSKLLCVLNPNDNITRSNMHIMLAEKINGTVMVDQFVHIFFLVLAENFDDFLSN